MEKLKEWKTQKKGITLIALVITIIVLLILAAVSIATLTGENGILTQAGISNTKTAHAHIFEEMQLELQSYTVEKNAGTYKNSFSAYLKSKGIINDEGIINVISLTESKTKYGNGTSIESGDVYVLEETTSMGKLATTTNVKVASTDDTTEYKVVYYGKTDSENVELGALFSEINSTNNLKYAYLFTVDQYGVVRLNPNYSFYKEYYYLTSKNGCKLTNLSLIIPSSIDGQEVTTIGGMPSWDSGNTYGLHHLKEVNTIKIPDTVNTIEDYAFRMGSLKTIQIPISVKNIGKSAFYAWGNMEKVYYEGTEEQWNNITIESGNENLTDADIEYNYTGNDIVEYAEETSTKISPETLYLTYTTNDEEKTASVEGNYGVEYATALTIPSKYTVDGVSYDVTSITSIVYFRECSSLTSITIPSSIITINSNAFLNCPALKNVFFNGTEEQWNALVNQDDTGVLANCNVQFN